MTTTTTTYMGLVLPNVLSRVGSAYASDYNTLTTVIDAHDHTSGKGKQIPAAGLAIDNNVSWGGYSITALKATSYTPQTTVATYNSHYFKTDGNAYIRNGSGTEVQLTSGSSIYSAAVLTTLWQSLAVASSPTIATADTYGHYRIDTSAARTITLPSASAVGAGRAYLFEDVTGTSETNNVTLARAGSDTINGATSYTIASNYGSVWLVSTGSGWRAVGGNVANQVLGTTLWFGEDVGATLIAQYEKGSGNATAMQLLAQSATSGNGGALTIRSGSANGGSGTGGAITLRAGSGHNTNTGGAVVIQSGNGGSVSGSPGSVSVVLGSTGAGATSTILSLYRNDSFGGGEYVCLGSGTPNALFGAANDKPSMYFTNAGATPDRTVFSTSTGFLLTSVGGKPVFTLGNGDQLTVTGVVAAAVGGVQSHKLQVVLNGTTYYIPANTA